VTEDKSIFAVLRANVRKTGGVYDSQPVATFESSNNWAGGF